MNTPCYILKCLVEILYIRDTVEWKTTDTHSLLSLNQQIMFLHAAFGKTHSFFYFSVLSFSPPIEMNGVSKSVIILGHASSESHQTSFWSPDPLPRHLRPSATRPPGLCFALRSNQTLNFLLWWSRPILILKSRVHAGSQMYNKGTTHFPPPLQLQPPAVPTKVVQSF